MNINTELDEQLREACCNGNTEMVQKLINSGVDVNSQNKMNGWTSLHWAAKRGHQSLVSTLLQNNADPSLKNVKGESPLDVAVDEKTKYILQNTTTILQNEVDDIVKLKTSSSDVKQEIQDSTLKGEYKFIPNYLKYPVFPHVQPGSSDDGNKLTDELSGEKLSKLHEVCTVNNRMLNNENELVLKVRLFNSSDFIEVELDFTQLTFDNLLCVCCQELEIDRGDILKVRKLPNTLLRKDKDIKRLEQFQELEFVLKPGPSSEYNPDV